MAIDFFASKQKFILIVRTVLPLLVSLIAFLTQAEPLRAQPNKQDLIGIILKQYLDQRSTIFANPGFNPGIFLPPQPGGEVHGTIYSLMRGKDNFSARAVFSSQQILLPDVDVYVEDVVTSSQSPHVRSDLNGTFEIPSMPQGKYRVCWKADGFINGCEPNPITLTSTISYLQPIGILADGLTLSGNVTLDDRSSCRMIAGFIGADFTSDVTAVLPDGSLRTVRVNNYNDYIFAGLPAGDVKLVASCENVATDAAVSLSSGSVIQNLVLPNSKPKIGAFYSQSNGQTTRAAAPGTIVQATIEAAPGSSGHPLHYRWAVTPEDPSFTSVDQSTIDVKIVGPGVTTIYVLVHDDFGGNTLRQMTLSSHPDQIIFSGHVRGDDSAAISDADVTISGATVKTDAAGNFIAVLPNEMPRYTISVEKIGYQLISQTSYSATKDANYLMHRAVQLKFNPADGVRYIEKARNNNDRPAVEVLLEPNSIALGSDGAGPLATATLEMHGAGYDLRDGNNPLPGDFTGLDKNNSPFRLSTFGAADVAITDGAGNHYNIAPGHAALIRIPIDPAMTAIAKATLPVWHFETKDGIWRQDGEATRVGNYYEAKVTHFSTVNMDLAFGDGACTRILVDETIMPTPFKIRMTPQTGGTVSPDHQEQTVSGPVSVVVRQPPGTVIKYEMVDSNGAVISAATQLVTTGASSSTGQQWPVTNSAPYTDCTSEVKYDLSTVSALFPTNTAQAFLTFRTQANLISGAAADTDTAAYFVQIDPNHANATLSKTAGAATDFTHWKSANGFDRPEAAHTIYSNNYDLGFGRDMHMQTGGKTGTCTSCIAYYVTNHPDVESAVFGADELATVAMEYSPRDGLTGTSYTKFYVFLNGAVQKSVDLDQTSPKNVPSLCVICHGGTNVTRNTTTGEIAGARFIPFDVESFGYTASTDPSKAQFKRPLNEVEFKKLNKQIFNTGPSPAVTEVVQHWYGNVGDSTLPLNFNGNAVPPNWSSSSAGDQTFVYNAVVKPACRACHITRDAPKTWNNYSELDGDSSFVRSLVCDVSSHTHSVMPQAKRTFARFWLSTQPNSPAALGNSGMSGFQGVNNSCPQ